MSGYATQPELSSFLPEVKQLTNVDNSHCGDVQEFGRLEGVDGLNP